MKKSIYIFGVLYVAICLISCTPQVEPEVKVQGINLNQAAVTLAAGDSVTLLANVSPAKARPKIVWSSSNPKVATVQDGKIKALARGSSTITVSADSVYTSTCVVTVTHTDLPYQLVWSDEFDGASLDPAKWNYEIGGGGWGNHQKEYCTNRPDNVRLENGNLVIEAKKEAYSGNDYTSGRINTRNKASFTYGKVEARISLPVGIGTWPAFWMLGYGSWPLCGEIDILEHIGSQPTMVSHAVHTTERNGGNGNNWYSRVYLPKLENEYHVYAIEWEQKANEGDDKISFYVDAVKSATIWERHLNSTAKDWPFNKNFFIILNLAIGGTMGGPVDDAMFDNPVLMKVDYVRVYQR
ncbi:MAG TPA: family 16 glycosylhydrolase [Paludibacter sp.]|nr:family 16 glycosylhydrolase [Paludibacter sp.]